MSDINNKQSFNSFERRIANSINSFPIVKRRLKKTYQLINYLLYKKPYNYKSKFKLENIDSELETFFGYYDKSPISEDNKYILYHESDFRTTQLPLKNKSISIQVLDIEKKQKRYINSVRAYNWQQGSKLQWLTNDSFIYNNFNEERGYHSIKITLNNEGIKEKHIPIPIYDCYKDEFALTLSFERLHALRPDYGYRNHKIDYNVHDLTQDGVTYYDFKTGETKVLFSVNDLLKIESDELILNTKNHLVNHIMISPSGKKFMFLHRYFVNGRRYDRLMTYSFKTDTIELIANNEMVSHCCWKDDNTILGYLRNEGNKNAYYIISLGDNKLVQLGENTIDSFGDGHPTLFENNKLLFDTYPDKARMKKLFIYDIENDKLDELGEFYESLKYYEQTRCDLHPRCSPDGSFIFFDSVHSGKRQLYWINLK